MYFYNVFGLLQTANPASSAVASIQAPANATGVYISSDQTLRVTVDGQTPSLTVGLYSPANTTSFFVCSAFVDVSVFNVGASVANVSFQFVGR